jgi:AraC-like DNA-binding protein
VSNLEFIIKASYFSVNELLETFIVNSAITTICFVLFSRNQNRVPSLIIVAYLLCVLGTVSLGDVNLDLSLQLPLITVFVAYWNLNRIQNKYWALLIAGILHSVLPYLFDLWEGFGVIYLVCYFSSLVLIFHISRSIWVYQELVLENFSFTKNKSLRWVLLLIGLLMAQHISILAGIFFEFQSAPILSNISLLGQIILIGTKTINSTTEVFIKHRLPGDKLKPPCTDLIDFETYHKTIVDQELFTIRDLTLTELSRILGTSNRCLSNKIKVSTAKNFNGYINSLRVDRVKELITEEGGKYTLFALAERSGFNSNSSFHTIFKDLAGMTPNEFKRLH